MRRTAALARHLTTPGSTGAAVTSGVTTSGVAASGVTASATASTSAGTTPRKVALVVGAGDALGSAVARKFAIEGGYVRRFAR